MMVGVAQWSSCVTAMWSCDLAYFGTPDKKVQRMICDKLMIQRNTWSLGQKFKKGRRSNKLLQQNAFTWQTGLEVASHRWKDDVAVKKKLLFYPSIGGQDHLRWASKASAKVAQQGIGGNNQNSSWRVLLYVRGHSSSVLLAHKSFFAYAAVPTTMRLSTLC